MIRQRQEAYEHQQAKRAKVRQSNEQSTTPRQVVQPQPSNSRLPLKARIQKDIEIINESGGLSYYKDSNNLPVGANSYLSPKDLGDVTGGDPFNISVQDTPNLWNYAQQAFEGQGQDVVIDARKISFDTDSAKFKQGLFNNSEFASAYADYLITQEPQPVNIESIQLQTHDPYLQQDFILGKVKLRMNGYIMQGPQGRPIFIGIVDQGDNAEVFTFPTGNRGFLKEWPTEKGRQSDLTQFRTIFRGNKPIWVQL